MAAHDSWYDIISQLDTANEVLSHRQFCRAETGTLRSGTAGGGAIRLSTATNWAGKV